MERLAVEDLEPAGSGDGGLVLFGELVDAQDGDDVLQVAVALEDALDLASRVVVLLADDVRVEHAGCGRQWIDGRIDAQLCDGPFKAAHGAVVTEALKQPNWEPLPMVQEVVELFAVKNGFLDDLPLEKVNPFLQAMYQYISDSHKDIIDILTLGQALPPDLVLRLSAAIADFKKMRP